ncbi:MAG: aspartate carbamoyltransferase regulatory subunit [Oscillospiraceae bacterium]|jgi:aspartate carbamoyltransferase regulatory subunit|nr:aspartate carbamoyltransferase regulatory subunit [Oscillospiraceae bacterium]
MNIDSIQNGIVIDHIRAGNSLRIYRYLELDKLACSVAIIQNCKSRKMGRKDIIKIDEEYEVNLDILGYLDPDATVTFIRDGKTALKRKCALPDKIINVIHCKNPRCITVTEPGLDQSFRLADRERKRYRCIYCDASMQA